MSGRLDLDDRDLDKAARALDGAVRDLDRAQTRLARYQGSEGAPAIAGALMSMQVGLARGVVRKAEGTADRQRLTLRRHAALTRIADGHPSGADFVNALPFLQRYDQPKPPSWWTKLRDLMIKVGGYGKDAVMSPTTWLSAMNAFFKEHHKALTAEVERLRRKGGTSWKSPAGLFGKVKKAAGWVGDQWNEAKRRILLAKASVKRAMAQGMRKLSAAVGLALAIKDVVTAESDEEAARAAIRGALSTIGAALGASGGASGGPLGAGAGAFAGAAAGDMLGNWLADQLFGSTPTPAPVAVPGL